METLRFGRSELRPAQRQLIVDGLPAAVGARAFDLLLALVERRDRAVSKGELLDVVWPGLVVEENNLQVQVSTLRKILGQDAIATIPGRGYRFTLAVASADEHGSTSSTRHNLPPQLTSFVGHGDDLADYAELLLGTRLLTLTGIGGCGKTRLAIELAGRVLPAFPDGVWFVDLAALSEHERLPFVIAETVQIRTQVGTPIVRTLCDRLAPLQTLLLLDNCEQLTEACGELAGHLLRAAPELRILATSREGLNVVGERMVSVRSLRTPPAGTEGDLDSVRSSEAVRLFIERAQVADRTFEVDGANAAVVAEVCRRLDGIPLAIELAAARMNVLSIQEIRSHLHQRFRLLGGGTSAALPRQQTLLAVIRWSYEHVPQEGQRLLRLLSVFEGGWTLAGAASMLEGADDYAALDALAQLADRSLIAIERLADGTCRYSMLETVRQYALEQLDATGEGSAARDRHLDFYLHVAEEQAPMDAPARLARWLEGRGRERENFLQALAWCEHAEDGGRKGVALVNALQSFWKHSGNLELGFDLTRAAALRDTSRDASRLDALLAAASLAGNIDRPTDGSVLLEEAASIARELGDEMATAKIARLQACQAHQRGDVETALRLIGSVLALARARQDEKFLIGALNATAEIHRSQGNLAAAQPLYEEALALARAHRNVERVAVISDNLARLLINAGQSQAAADLVLEVLHVSSESRSRWIGLCALDITTALAAEAADWPFAARMRGAAEARVKSIAHRRDSVDEAFISRWTPRIRAALREEEYRAAFDAGYVLAGDVPGAEALSWLRQHWGRQGGGEACQFATG